MCISGGITVEQTPSIRAKQLVKEVHPIKKLMANETSVLTAVMAGAGVSCTTTIFSLNLPFMIQPKAAAEVYRPAFYSYDARLSFFDNSAWTYITDYILAVIMGVLAYHCASARGDWIVLKQRAAGLLTCYAISVAAGGMAHQFYTSLEARNSLSFRLLWTICVGTVTAAGGFMGSCAAEISHFFGYYRVPGWFWAGFATFTTFCCAGGLMSFQRPAADIFVAGITQFPSTFVMIEAVVKRSWQGKLCHVNASLCVVGFSLNAPLLPLYAFLLFHTNWSLPAVNTLLHCWLCVTWAMQGASLLYFIKLMGRAKST